MTPTYADLVEYLNKITTRPDRAPSDAWIPASMAATYGYDVDLAPPNSWLHLQRGRAFWEWFESGDDGPICQMEAR